MSQRLIFKIYNFIRHRVCFVTWLMGTLIPPPTLNTDVNAPVTFESVALFAYQIYSRACVLEPWLFELYVDALDISIINWSYRQLVTSSTNVYRRSDWSLVFVHLLGADTLIPRLYVFSWTRQLKHNTVVTGTPTRLMPLIWSEQIDN